MTDIIEVKADQSVIVAIKQEMADLRDAKYALENFSLHDIKAAYLQATRTRTTRRDIGKLLGVSTVNVDKMIAAHRYLMNKEADAK